MIAAAPSVGPNCCFTLDSHPPVGAKCKLTIQRPQSQGVDAYVRGTLRRCDPQWVVLHDEESGNERWFRANSVVEISVEAPPVTRQVNHGDFFKALGAIARSCPFIKKSEGGSSKVLVEFRLGLRGGCPFRIETIGHPAGAECGQAECGQGDCPLHGNCAEGNAKPNCRSATLPPPPMSSNETPVLRRSHHEGRRHLPLFGGGPLQYAPPSPAPCPPEFTAPRPNGIAPASYYNAPQSSEPVAGEPEYPRTNCKSRAWNEWSLPAGEPEYPRTNCEEPRAVVVPPGRRVVSLNLPPFMPGFELLRAAR